MENVFLLIFITFLQVGQTFTPLIEPSDKYRISSEEEVGGLGVINLYLFSLDF